MAKGKRNTKHAPYAYSCPEPTGQGPRTTRGQRDASRCDHLGTSGVNPVHPGLKRDSLLAVHSVNYPFSSHLLHLTNQVSGSNLRSPQHMVAASTDRNVDIFAEPRSGHCRYHRGSIDVLTERGRLPDAKCVFFQHCVAACDSACISNVGLSERAPVSHLCWRVA